jgi:serine/threonine protein kinase
MSGGSGQPPASGRADRIPAPGEIIASKYEVQRVLGAGGMGVVLAARHIQLGQTVAIKFMRGQAAADSAAVGRFQREARAIAALSSEHVARAYDVGTLESGAPYIVLEYLAGEDLGELLRRSGPMAVPDVLGAVLQACEALAEAHAIGIVHRDLKPSNLFVTRRKDGSRLVKVLDFGISKMASFNTAASNDSLTASGAIMGSPAYMSPEQVRSAKEADARADIWALGVIVYELVTGRSPFAGETLGETFARILSETPAPLHELRPDVPEGLGAAVARCLERNVERRVQTVAELASRLAPFAPPESALSVERILRMSGASGETMAAAGAQVDAASSMIAAPLPSPNAGPPGGPLETGPPWLRSHATSLRRSRTPSGLVITTAAAIVLAASFGVYALRRPGGSGVPSTTDTALGSRPAPSAAPPARALVLPAAAAEGATASVTATTGLDGGEAPPASPPPETRASTPHRPVERNVPARTSAPRPPPAARPAAGAASDPPLDDMLNSRQ